MKMYARLILFVSVHLAFCSGQGAVTDVPCKTNRSDLCIQNLATLTTLDQPLFADTLNFSDSLNVMCGKASDGVRCTMEYLRSNNNNCLNDSTMLAINDQLNRSLDVSRLLCKNNDFSTFKTDYLSASPCISKQMQIFTNCYASSGLSYDPELWMLQNSNSSDEEKYKSACCPIRNYVNCSEATMGQFCEEKYEYVVSTVLKVTAGQQLDDFCTALERRNATINETCTISGANSVISMAVVIIMCLSIFVVF